MSDDICLLGLRKTTSKQNGHVSREWQLEWTYTKSVKPGGRAAAAGAPVNRGADCSHDRGKPSVIGLRPVGRSEELMSPMVT